MRMGQGERTGGHGGITCVLQTQFSLFYLSKKIRLDVSCESSA